MKKLSIFKDGQEIRSGNFSDQELLNLYLEKLSKNGIVGLRPERSELMLDEATGEMIPTGNILPAEYEIVIEDITAQIEQEKINQEARQFLSSTDWKILRHRDQIDLGVTTSLTRDEFQLLLNERQLARQRVV